MLPLKMEMEVKKLSFHLRLKFCLACRLPSHSLSCLIYSEMHLVMSITLVPGCFGTKKCFKDAI